jgi:hypothetical protein
VEFEDAWAEKQDMVVAGQHLSVLSRRHLVRNKRAAGRPKDLADLAWLESEEAGP